VPLAQSTLDEINNRLARIESGVDDVRYAIHGNGTPGLKSAVLTLQDQAKRRDRLALLIGGPVITALIGLAVDRIFVHPAPADAEQPKHASTK
jgi:hypothetical protein